MWGAVEHRPPHHLGAVGLAVTIAGPSLVSPAEPNHKVSRSWAALGLFLAALVEVL